MASATAYDGKLWVTGSGLNPFTNATWVAVFDPASNTWDESKANMIAGRKYHVVAVLGGELIAAGGLMHPTPSASTSFAEKYDPRTDAWSDVPEMAIMDVKFRSFAAACE